MNTPIPADGDSSKRIRHIVIAVVAIALVAFGVALYLAIRNEGRQERWDLLAQVRQDGEPGLRADPLFEAPVAALNPERRAYIQKLEAFLKQKAIDSGDALEPHTRYLVAKTIADHLLANPGMRDENARHAYYAQAREQLETIRDKFPDFPLNWTALSEEGSASLTRQFIQWLEDNEAWEKEHMLRARAPSADVRVLLRTTRGDMLMGLYTKDAPTWTAAFVQRAVRGFYDGTCFVSKREVGDVSAPEEFSLRAAGTLSRGLRPYDAAGTNTASEAPSRSGMLPDEARNRIPHDRGIVSAWHQPSTEYDNAEQFLVLARPSPLLDYKYTPIGKLLDEGGVHSLATLDDIFASDTWNTDKKTRDDTELRGILDWLRVPVTITKVLVYRNGKLLEPAEGEALPTKVATEPKERALADVQTDRYKIEAPKPPSDDSDGEAPKKDDAEK